MVATRSKKNSLPHYLRSSGRAGGQVPLEYYLPTRALRSLARKAGIISVSDSIFPTLRKAIFGLLLELVKKTIMIIDSPLGPQHAYIVPEVSKGTMRREHFAVVMKAMGWKKLLVANDNKQGLTYLKRCQGYRPSGLGITGRDGKPLRRDYGYVARTNTRKLMQSDECLVLSKTSFSKLLTQIAKSFDWNPPSKRISEDARLYVQLALEAHVMDLLSKAGKAAKHAKRKVASDKNFEFVHSS